MCVSANAVRDAPLTARLHLPILFGGAKKYWLIGRSAERAAEFRKGPQSTGAG